MKLKRKTYVTWSIGIFNYYAIGIPGKGNV